MDGDFLENLVRSLGCPAGGPPGCRGVSQGTSDRDCGRRARFSSVDPFQRKVSLGGISQSKVSGISRKWISHTVGVGVVQVMRVGSPEGTGDRESPYGAHLHTGPTWEIQSRSDDPPS
jgi:hypothetical protein